MLLLRLLLMLLVLNASDMAMDIAIASVNVVGRCDNVIGRVLLLLAVCYCCLVVCCC